MSSTWMWVIAILIIIILIGVGYYIYTRSYPSNGLILIPNVDKSEILYKPTDSKISPSFKLDVKYYTNKDAYKNNQNPIKEEIYDPTKIGNVIPLDPNSTFLTARILTEKPGPIATIDLSPSVTILPGCKTGGCNTEVNNLVPTKKVRSSFRGLMDANSY